jgi:hydrogenase nickel incorporation protein HypB
VSDIAMDNGARTIPIVEKILSTNDQLADENAQRFGRLGLEVVNIMASPGGGKTSLILRTIEALRGRCRIGVIEGDVASQVDSQKIAVTSTPVVQINTGGQCHLDANMIRSALDQLRLEELDLLLIENVGNLICPVDFRLGEGRNVAIASVPEGDDKPYKYPAIFQAADAVVINKVDLLPYLDFDEVAFKGLVCALNPDVALFEVSCKTGQGIADWAEWLLAS